MLRKRHSKRHSKKQKNDTTSEASSSEQSSPHPTEHIESSGKKQTTHRRRHSIIGKLILLLIIIAAIVGVFFLVKNYLSTSKSAMNRKLESYATEIYEKELKGRDSNSYTINLNYLERNGYDISAFEENNCDKSSTYIVVNVAKDSKEIETITPQLNCDKNSE